MWIRTESRQLSDLFLSCLKLIRNKACRMAEYFFSGKPDAVRIRITRGKKKIPERF